MHYYIDGYNLLFRVLKVEENLQVQREAVLQELAKKAQLIDLSATIVFDAHYQPGPVSKGHFKNLEVIYTSEKESADEYIQRVVKRIKNPRFVTVVTSDKKLAWLCRMQGSNTETISAFLGWLNRRYQNELVPPTKKPKEPLKVIDLSLAPPKPGTASYYEAIFEGELVQEQAQTSAPPAAPPVVKDLPTKELPQEPESDFDRYMRLFGESDR